MEKRKKDNTPLEGYKPTEKELRLIDLVLDLLDDPYLNHHRENLPGEYGIRFQWAIQDSLEAGKVSTPTMYNITEKEELDEYKVLFKIEGMKDVKVELINEYYYHISSFEKDGGSYFGYTFDKQLVRNNPHLFKKIGK